MKFLVIVESPAKISKISSYLNTITNHSFIVDASYGHICEFKDGLKSIDINNNFKAVYGITSTKLKIANNLKKIAKEVDEVIIATDRDREGEAIGYHLITILKLDINTTKRISFNEISKKAIVDAFNNPGLIDINLYNAQQARSILDILIGYNISPLLWKSIQPKLSAGRCQSPALKLVYERDKEITEFISNSSYELMGNFVIKNKEPFEISAKYFKDIVNKDSVKLQMEKLIDEIFYLTKQKIKNISNSPPPPYITSSIQQDVSSKFGLSPITTMSILQKLYESGKITYMRTDSTIISDNFVASCKLYIDKNYPGEFTKRNYKSKVANAQEAHECIRPVCLDIKSDDIADSLQKKIYNVIWKRTIASLMSNCREESHEFRFINKDKEYFTTCFKKIINLGFKKIYNPEIMDDRNIINNIVVNKDNYSPIKIEAVEKNSKPKSRYTEASLVKELESLGIGRPSTFSSIVNTLITRKYVTKENTDTKKEIILNKLSIKPNESIAEKTFKSKAPSQKGKLIITSLGIYVNEYMTTHFKNINSYQFTSNINDKLDNISNGSIIWYNLVSEVYKSFINKVQSLQLVSNTNNVNNKCDNEKLLFETDINKYYYYRDKYGLCIIKEYNNERKKIRENNIDINNVSIEYLEEQFKYPILIGKHKDIDIYIKKGPYGKYTEIEGTKVSIENNNITIEELLDKVNLKKKNIIKEWKSIKILNGPYGPYIKKGNKNVPIPKNIEPLKLTALQCEEMVKKYKKPFYNKKHK